MTQEHPITPPPPHLLKKFSAQAQDEAKKRNGAGYLKTFAILCIEWAMNSKTTPNDRQIRSSEIEPSSELVEQWRDQAPEGKGCQIRETWLATQAARWGADQELEACCVWLEDFNCSKRFTAELRTARRPKPSSLKEQALQALANADGADHPVVVTVLTADQHALIRKALEQLDD